MLRLLPNLAKLVKAQPRTVVRKSTNGRKLVKAQLMEVRKSIKGSHSVMLGRDGEKTALTEIQRSQPRGSFSGVGKNKGCDIVDNNTLAKYEVKTRTRDAAGNAYCSLPFAQVVDRLIFIVVDAQDSKTCTIYQMSRGALELMVEINDSGITRRHNGYRINEKHLKRSKYVWRNKIRMATEARESIGLVTVEAREIGLVTAAITRDAHKA